jgi:hypothetical protein
MSENTSYKSASALTMSFLWDIDALCELLYLVPKNISFDTSRQEETRGKMWTHQLPLYTDSF